MVLFKKLSGESIYVNQSEVVFAGPADNECTLILMRGGVSAIVAALPDAVANKLQADGCALVPFTDINDTDIFVNCKNIKFIIEGDDGDCALAHDDDLLLHVKVPVAEAVAKFEV